MPWHEHIDQLKNLFWILTSTLTAVVSGNKKGSGAATPHVLANLSRRTVAYTKRPFRIHTRNRVPQIPVL